MDRPQSKEQIRMLRPRPTRPHKVIVTLVAVCILVGLFSRSVTMQMTQDDRDQQAFAALQHGGKAELAAVLDQGADPNYGPRNPSHKTGLSGLITDLVHGRIARHVRNEMPMLGFALNGLSNEHPRAALHARQFKAMHILPPPLTCTDPLGKMRVLLEHHADPNRCYNDANPLVHAVGQNRADAVQLLLQHGADPDAQTANGDTARKVASRFRYGPLLALMQADSGRRNMTRSRP